MLSSTLDEGGANDLGNRPDKEKPLPENDGARFLVVDDNDDNRYSLTQRLKRLGYTNVLTADNGRHALDVIRNQPLDIVLLDILMPEMDGYQVLERLREQELLSRLPVIVISALDDLESVVRCIELGAEDYLPKPFNATLLEARISGTLEKKRLHDEVRRQLSIIRSVFGKYVPDGVVDAIVSGRGELAPRNATATILYSDIVGFTAVSERLSPERVLQMLNEYFPAVIEPIMRYRRCSEPVSGRCDVGDLQHSPRRRRTRAACGECCSRDAASAPRPRLRRGSAGDPHRNQHRKSGCRKRRFG